MRLGPWEIGLIIVVVIILFGARRIPEIMRGLGSGIKEFKAGLREGEKNKADDKEPKEPKEEKQ